MDCSLSRMWSTGAGCKNCSPRLSRKVSVVTGRARRHWKAVVETFLIHTKDFKINGHVPGQGQVKGQYTAFSSSGPSDQSDGSQRAQTHPRCGICLRKVLRENEGHYPRTTVGGDLFCPLLLFRAISRRYKRTVLHKRIFSSPPMVNLTRPDRRKTCQLW